jgi:hypothetical protein
MGTTEAARQTMPFATSLRSRSNRRISAVNGRDLSNLRPFSGHV